MRWMRRERLWSGGLEGRRGGVGDRKGMDGGREGSWGRNKVKKVEG